MINKMLKDIGKDEKKATYLSGIVEHGSSGIQGEVVVGHNAGSAPLLTVEIDLQHVIRHVLSETKLFVRDLGLGGLGTLNRDVGLLQVRLDGVKAYSSGEGADERTAL